MKTKGHAIHQTRVLTRLLAVLVFLTLVSSSMLQPKNAEPEMGISDPSRSSVPKIQPLDRSMKPLLGWNSSIGLGGHVMSSADGLILVDDRGFFHTVCQLHPCVAGSWEEQYLVHLWNETPSTLSMEPVVIGGSTGSMPNLFKWGSGVAMVYRDLDADNAPMVLWTWDQGIEQKFAFLVNISEGMSSCTGWSLHPSTDGVTLLFVKQVRDGENYTLVDRVTVNHDLEIEETVHYLSGNGNICTMTLADGNVIFANLTTGAEEHTVFVTLQRVIGMNSTETLTTMEINEALQMGSHSVLEMLDDQHLIFARPPYYYFYDLDEESLSVFMGNATEELCIYKYSVHDGFMYFQDSRSFTDEKGTQYRRVRRIAPEANPVQTVFTYAVDDGEDLSVSIMGFGELNGELVFGYARDLHPAEAAAFGNPDLVNVLYLGVPAGMVLPSLIPSYPSSTGDSDESSNKISFSVASTLITCLVVCRCLLLRRRKMGRVSISR